MSSMHGLAQHSPICLKPMAIALVTVRITEARHRLGLGRSSSFFHNVPSSKKKSATLKSARFSPSNFIGFYPEFQFGHADRRTNAGCFEVRSHGVAPRARRRHEAV